MFERFTERSRQVIILAQEESRTLKHDYIGAEHILLGLLREEEGIAARVLDRFDITVLTVRNMIAQAVGSNPETSHGQLPFTPRAKRIMELALREALNLGHNYIGTEHLLLGLLRENEGLAMQIVHDFDVHPDNIRAEVIRMLKGGGGQIHKKVEEQEAQRANHLHVAAEHAVDCVRSLLDHVDAKLAEIKQREVSS